MRLALMPPVAQETQDYLFPTKYIEKGGSAMKAFTLVTVVIGLSGLALSAMAQQPNSPATQTAPSAPPPAMIEKAVKHCVDVVHQFPAHNQIEIPGAGEFYKHFDAFYNPATARVENNGYLNGDIPPQYQFKKCMGAQGFFFSPDQ
jgi:hypothetical protein